MKDFEDFYAPDRATWRQWLADNHKTSKGVWLICFKKKTGKPCVPYIDSVEEALCFGWIDSVKKIRDDMSSKQFFSPRKPKSGWAKTNKERVERLITEGLMTEAGMEKINIAKQNGAWNALDEVEKLTVPDDLAVAFDENPLARNYWDAFPPSVRRGILEWISNAKTAETREKRIIDTATKAAQNIRANQYVKK
jgi:uncharacterized protein YdeI (YjbR/CyaY-like superfamily)